MRENLALPAPSSLAAPPAGAAALAPVGSVAEVFCVLVLYQELRTTHACQPQRRLSRRAPPPLSCTDWTRLVLPPVLSGYVSSFSPY